MTLKLTIDLPNRERIKMEDIEEIQDAVKEILKDSECYIVWNEINGTLEA